MNGTSAPSDRATLAMSDASVDRITRSNAPDSRAASAVYAINGLPPSRRRFFPGSPFDPPRAVITPRTFKGISMNHEEHKDHQEEIFVSFVIFVFRLGYRRSSQLISRSLGIARR